MPLYTVALNLPRPQEDEFRALLSQQNDINWDEKPQGHFITNEMYRDKMTAYLSKHWPQDHILKYFHIGNALSKDEQDWVIELFNENDVRYRVEDNMIYVELYEVAYEFVEYVKSMCLVDMDPEDLELLGIVYVERSEGVYIKRILSPLISFIRALNYTYLP